MDVFYIFASVAFFIWSIRSFFYWVDRWQKIASGRVTWTGKVKFLLSFLFSPLSLLTWAGIIVGFYLAIIDFQPFVFQMIVLALLGMKAAVVVWEISTERFIRPNFTPRLTASICVAIFITALLFALPMTERYLWILILDRLLVFLIAISIFFLTFPTEIYDDLQIRRAAKKIKAFKHLTSILIIGRDASEIAATAAQILQRDTQVVVITDQYLKKGRVAQQLLKKVHSQTEYIITGITESQPELIFDLCRLTGPDYIVMSSLSDTRYRTDLLSTVASFLPKKGSLIMDTSFAGQKNSLLAKKKTITYTAEQSELADKNIVYPQDIIEKKDNFSFKLVVSSTTHSLKIPLIGLHHLTYLVPAVALAQVLGISEQKIKDALQMAVPLKTSFVSHRLKTGVMIVDATRLSNTSHLLQSIGYLKLYKGQRVVVMGIEDELTNQEMKTLGARLLSLTTSIFLRSERYRPIFRTVARAEKTKSGITVVSDEHILRYMHETMVYGDTVIFLGHTSKRLLEEILLTYPTN